jgi:hypothetical protein
MTPNPTRGNNSVQVKTTSLAKPSRLRLCLRWTRCRGSVTQGVLTRRARPAVPIDVRAAVCSISRLPMMQQSRRDSGPRAYGR